MPATPQESFGQLNFAHAQLKDKRRTKRLVSLADRIHRHPGGYICHNSLAVDPQLNSFTQWPRERNGAAAAIGLTNQILHCRIEVPEKETQREHRERESRESRLWVQGTEGLPADARLVDVCDRGADTFEFLEHEWNGGRSFVVRSSQNRTRPWPRVEEASAARLAAVAADRRRANSAGLRSRRKAVPRGGRSGEFCGGADIAAAGA